MYKYCYSNKCAIYVKRLSWSIVLFRSISPAPGDKLLCYFISSVLVLNCSRYIQVYKHIKAVVHMKAVFWLGILV